MPYNVISVSQMAKDGKLVNNVDDEVIFRIRKMLDRAEHKDTPQSEADQSMKLAQRELKRYNLERETVVMATDIVKKADRGSLWTVAVTSENWTPVSIFAWIEELLYALTVGFQVEYYYYNFDGYTHFVFYGLQKSAEIAAAAFKAYFTRIEAMASNYVPKSDAALKQIEQDYAEKVANGTMGFFDAMKEFEKNRPQTLRTLTRQGRDCYRFGLAHGLQQIFEQEEQDERVRIETLEAKVEKERRARKAKEQHERALAKWKEEETAHIMREMADGRLGADIGPLIIDVDEDFDLEEAEREIAACKALVPYTKEVAQAVLVEFDIKIKVGKRKPFQKRNIQAYEDGKTDAKKMRTEVAQEGK
jgi:hypothetical protein